LLVRADDVGENYVEKDDRAMSRPFKELSSKIDRGFAELTTLSSPQERRVAASARARWEQVFAAASIAASLPSDRYGVKLDEFHDVIDEAGSLVADAYTLNLNQVADEISSVQQRERRQLWTALAILDTSLIAAGLLGRRVYRSITTPLALLEGRLPSSARMSYHIGSL